MRSRISEKKYVEFGPPYSVYLGIGRADYQAFQSHLRKIPKKVLRYIALISPSTVIIDRYSIVATSFASLQCQYREYTR